MKDKPNIVLKCLDSGLWKVEVTDAHGDWISVCEETPEECMAFATKWLELTEIRKKRKDSWGECIKKMVEEDRKNGRNWE